MKKSIKVVILFSAVCVVTLIITMCVREYRDNKETQRRMELFYGTWYGELDLTEWLKYYAAARFEYGEELADFDTPILCPIYIEFNEDGTLEKRADEKEWAEAIEPLLSEIAVICPEDVKRWRDIAKNQARNSSAFNGWKVRWNKDNNILYEYHVGGNMGLISTGYYWCYTLEGDTLTLEEPPEKRKERTYPTPLESVTYKRVPESDGGQ